MVITTETLETIQKYEVAYTKKMLPFKYNIAKHRFVSIKRCLN